MRKAARPHAIRSFWTRNQSITWSGLIVDLRREGSLIKKLKWHMTLLLHTEKIGVLEYLLVLGHYYYDQITFCKLHDFQ